GIRSLGVCMRCRGDFSELHQYLDDNPSGTASDDYEIIVTIEDDDL
ncbi:unnamed protein product, partial [marine sediment metagenome]